MTKATIIVSGWLQPVGYRAFVKRVAVQLGLEGLVRNLSDGRVGVFCKGKRECVDEFLRLLDYKGRKGDPLSAYVENIEVYVKGEEGYCGPWRKVRGFEVDFGFKVKSARDRELLECMEKRAFCVASYRDELFSFGKRNLSKP
jgi:acylphosphatase